MNVMEIREQISLEDAARLEGHFDETSTGLSTSPDPAQRPAERIARGLNKAFLATMVVVFAGAAGLAHNRVNNDLYQPVSGFEELASDVAAQAALISKRFVGLEGAERPMIGIEIKDLRKPHGDAPAIVARYADSDAEDPVAWFNETGIRSPIITTILSAHGYLLDDASGKYDLGASPAGRGLPDPAGIKALIQSVAMQPGLTLDHAVDIVSTGLTHHVKARQLCGTGMEGDGCRMVVLPYGEGDGHALVLDAETGFVATLEVQGDIRDGLHTAYGAWSADDYELVRVHQ